MHSADQSGKAEHATIAMLEGVTHSRRGGSSCVAVYDARGNFDALVREVAKRIPKIELRQLGISRSELRRIVRTVLQKLVDLNVVFTARKGQWVLHIQRWRDWLGSSSELHLPRSIADSSPPYVNHLRG